MALSKSDQQFYEGKLSLGTFSYLFLATVVIGTVMWPVLLYLQDWSIGQTGKWTSQIFLNLAMMGFLLGTVVSVVMYLGFKFLLAMHWLPSRR